MRGPLKLLVSTLRRGRARGEREDLLRLGKAFSHPMRVEIVELAIHRPISPRQFEPTDQASPESVLYHFARAAELGALEVARLGPTRADRSYIASARAMAMREALWRRRGGPR